MDQIMPPRAPQPTDPYKTPSGAGRTPLAGTPPLAVGTAAATSMPTAPSGHTGRLDRIEAWLHHHWLVTAIAAGVLLTGGGATAYVLMRQPAPKAPAAQTFTPTPTATPAPTPVTKAAPLTGLPIEPAAASRPISAVMVENLYPDARPQSGLQSAGVVYEALAEGGITRFLAIFGDQQPASIGPVRSLRPYYIDWAMEFGASLSHAGGSADALALVGPSGVKDLNALNLGAPTYFRTRDRVAPHNLYTSSSLLDAINTKYGFNQAPTFAASPRKADAPVSPAPNPTININFSSAAYAVQYRYDAAANNYVRYLGGVPHVDKNTGQAITVKNIVVEAMPITYTAAPHDSQYVNMPTIGSGKATVFRDGGVVTGTWTKASRTARTTLTDAAGKAIELNTGNTWYEIVPTGRPVSY